MNAKRKLDFDNIVDFNEEGNLNQIKIDEKNENNRSNLSKKSKSVIIDRNSKWNSFDAVIWTPRTIDNELSSSSPNEEIDSKYSKKATRKCFKSSSFALSNLEMLKRFVSKSDFHGTSFIVSLIHENLLEYPSRKEYDSLLSKTISKRDWKCLAILLSLKSEYRGMPFFELCFKVSLCIEELDDACTASELSELTVCLHLVSQPDTILTKDQLISLLRLIAEKTGYGYLGRQINVTGGSKIKGTVTGYRVDMVPPQYTVTIDPDVKNELQNNRQLRKDESKFFEHTEKLLSTSDLQKMLDSNDKNKYQTPRPTSPAKLLSTTKPQYQNSKSSNELHVGITLDTLLLACRNDDILCIVLAYLAGLDVCSQQTKVRFPESVKRFGSDQTMHEHDRSMSQEQDEDSVCSDTNLRSSDDDIDNESKKGMNVCHYCTMIGAHSCGFFLRAIKSGHISIFSSSRSVEKDHLVV